MCVSLRTEIKMARRAARKQMNSVGGREANIFEMQLKPYFRGHVAR